MAQILLKRAYDPPEPEDGFRVLADRLWPRGLTRERAAVDHWAKDLAPSAELRQWFGHDPARWSEFEARYRDELAANEAALVDLLTRAGRRRITLLYAAKDPEHNNALALAETLRRMRARSR